jgi:transcriptional regulator with XRE-family HTH domain
MTFATKLQELREQANLTQVALAEASGISLGAIRDYEQGKREPTLWSGIMLAKSLGISLDVFADHVGNTSVKAKEAKAKVNRRKAKKK